MLLHLAVCEFSIKTPLIIVFYVKQLLYFRLYSNYDGACNLSEILALLPKLKQLPAQKKNSNILRTYSG